MDGTKDWSKMPACLSFARTRRAMDFTFMICTYNRRVLLERCLRNLMQLDCPPTVRWEALVVDNASTDGTGAMVEALAREWEGPGPAPRGGDRPLLRLVRELRRGTGYARRTGIAASEGRWVVFVDDDCFLETDWLVEAARFVESHPEVGVIGGRNALEWESPPPELCEAYGESLARQDWGDLPMPVPEKGRRAFCGAGVVLNRQAALDSGYVQHGHLPGRRGRSMAAGEDTEVQLLIRNAGWPLWYVPALRLRHWIPTERMSLAHLLPLHRGFGEVEAYLRLLEERRSCTLGNRWLGVKWAWQELRAVRQRFWLGCVKYRNERPTWFIRLWYACGYLKGAVGLLVLGGRKTSHPQVLSR